VNTLDSIVLFQPILRAYINQHRVGVTVRIKRRVKPGLGFVSFETAWNTLQGDEVMNMVSKGHMRGVEQGDLRGQVAFIASLSGMAA
jgi:transposase-like protein